MKIIKNQKGFTHHIMLAGVALVVLGALGFAGFRVYKSKNDISAKAAGFQTLKTYLGTYPAGEKLSSQERAAMVGKMTWVGCRTNIRPGEAIIKLIPYGAYALKTGAYKDTSYYADLNYANGYKTQQSQKPITSTTTLVLTTSNPRDQFTGSVIVRKSGGAPLFYFAANFNASTVTTTCP